ncbi:hypothetical protein [Nonomuraea jabiensis]|uniref:Uncharacterized protein n=1 Tax=Nonomuraea jabiensis TaxID=882448 RepID=A0A7W9FYV6_9ACTN|nr:hypothetical protein [Nonomuraea jabiensis]MBB5774060.1 hypothetical protein [Nonomuraea jabiensis]
MRGILQPKDEIPAVATGMQEAEAFRDHSLALGRVQGPSMKRPGGLVRVTDMQRPTFVLQALNQFSRQNVR